MPTERVTPTLRAVVTDSHALRRLCTPLGPRLGLIEVRSPAEWRRLRELAPGLGACPDLARGTVVGIACWAGEPVDGAWPIRVEGVRMWQGAALVDATFRGGTFLPDGAAYLEAFYVAGLRDVLGVHFNGTLFRAAE